MKELSFLENEVNFTNQYDNVKLSGTLSIPNSKIDHPCVILISGSGPQTRDQDVYGHKIFKDIAHFFSNNGIAVLRFDDRGVGKSEGIFDNAGLIDFRNDIIFAYKFISTYPKIDKRKIGLLGHSIGGLLAPMVALELKEQLAFIISLAGPGMIGYELYNKQHTLIAKTQGATESAINQMTILNKKMCDLILRIDDKKELLKKIKTVSFYEHKDKAFILKYYEKIKLEIFFILHKKAFQTFVQSWFKEWLMLKPEDYWQKVKCPVLAINGGRDLQMPPENLDLIEKHLREGENNEFETKIFPEMNHLFQKADKGLPEEYAKINNSISNEVLKFISDWIVSK